MDGWYNDQIRFFIVQDTVLPWYTSVASGIRTFSTLANGIHCSVANPLSLFVDPSRAQKPQCGSSPCWKWSAVAKVKEKIKIFFLGGGSFVLTYILVYGHNGNVEWSQNFQLAIFTSYSYGNIFNEIPNVQQKYSVKVKTDEIFPTITKFP